MSLGTTQTTNISRTLTADVNGRITPVVVMSGQVVPGAAVSLSVSIADKAVAAANADDVAKAFEAFVEAVRQMALEHGLPV